MVVVAMLNPEVFKTLIEPDYVPQMGSSSDEEEVFFPTSEDEFEAMIREWEGLG